MGVPHPTSLLLTPPLPEQMARMALPPLWMKETSAIMTPMVAANASSLP